MFLSFLKEMFPNCSTEDTTLSMAVIKGTLHQFHGTGLSWTHFPPVSCVTLLPDCKEKEVQGGHTVCAVLFGQMA